MGLSLKTVPPPFNGNYTSMPVEDDVTTYLLVAKNNNILRDDCILVEPDVSAVVVKPKIPKDFKKVNFVKAGDLNQEVLKIEKISNTEFIQNKIFEEAEKFEKESKDPFFKK
ncbi:hypothetical protein L1987_28322 [Smallanthus sonchifolius]|uniref:Uncharacterized protein n=1 Tax=Smallanthus sonchifolius TaxID=185202 RepID=A0ACB9IF45_9ASTR|nr:hypothetical protein L1987_28322 [Smallanthus sonchifolius]